MFYVGAKGVHEHQEADLESIRFALLKGDLFAVYNRIASYSAGVPERGPLCRSRCGGSEKPVKNAFPSFEPSRNPGEKSPLSRAPGATCPPGGAGHRAGTVSRRGRERGSSRGIHRKQRGPGARTEEKSERGKDGRKEGGMDRWMDGRIDGWMVAPLPHRKVGPLSARKPHRPAFPRTARAPLQPGPRRPVRPQPAAEPTRDTPRRRRARGAAQPRDGT